MKLGVFDSGIGGEAVATALRGTFPDANIITVNDHEHVPYGNKLPSEIIQLTDAAIQPMLKTNCDVIILACNTATAIGVRTLRIRYPQQKFIGIEPMVKTAATLTTSKKIAVCATPITLASHRYHELVALYAQNVFIMEPDCSKWAYMIENDQINHQIIKRTINKLCKDGADIIVLGCTHYHWIKDYITKVADGRAIILEPSEAIGHQVRTLLQSS
jgi:glutamate racemase